MTPTSERPAEAPLTGARLPTRRAPRPPRRWVTLAVATVLLGLAVSSRFIGVDDKAKWVDEYYSVRRAEGRFDTGVNPNVFPDGIGVVVPKIAEANRPRGGIVDVLEEPLTVHPPLYFLILRGWIELFGAGLFALRSLTAIISTLTIGAAAACAWIVAGRRAAAVTAALLIVAPLEIDLGQQIKGYALLGLWAMTATALLGWIARGDDGGPRRSQRGWAWAAYAIVAALAVWTHYLGALIVAAHGLAWLTSGRPRSLRPPIRAAALYVAAIAPLVWFVRVPILAGMRDQVHGMAWLVPAVRSEGGFLERRLHVPSALPELFFQATSIRSILAAALVLVLLAVVLRRKDVRTRAVALLALAGPLTVIAFDLVTAGNAMSMAGGRYTMVSSAALWTAVGIGLSRPKPLWGVLGVGLIAFVQVPSALAYYRSPVRPGYVDYGVVARAMNAAGCDERDLVIWAAGGGAVLLELNSALTGNPRQLLVEGVDERIDWLALEKPWRTVWVVAQPGTARALLDVLEARFPRASFAELEGVDVRRYAWQSAASDQPRLADRLLRAAPHRLKQLWWHGNESIARVVPAVRAGRIVLEATYDVEHQQRSRVRLIAPMDSVRAGSSFERVKDLSERAAIVGRAYVEATPAPRQELRLFDHERNVAVVELEPRHVGPDGRFRVPLAELSADEPRLDLSDCTHVSVEVVAEGGAGTLVLEELAVE